MLNSLRVRGSMESERDIPNNQCGGQVVGLLFNRGAMVRRAKLFESRLIPWYTPIV